MTYILGYILTLLFVPLVAPRLMRINLKEEAAKLEATLSGGAAPKTNNLDVSEISGARLSGFDRRRP